MTQPNDPTVQLFVDAIDTIDQLVVALTAVAQDADPLLELAAPILETVGYVLEGVGEGVEPYCPYIGFLIGLGLEFA